MSRKRVGWRGETIRHGLASRGIRNSTHASRGFPYIDSIEYNPFRIQKSYEATRMPDWRLASRAGDYIDLSVKVPVGPDRFSHVQTIIAKLNSLRENIEPQLYFLPMYEQDERDAMVQYRRALEKIAALERDDRSMLLSDMVLLGGTNIIIDMAYIVPRDQSDPENSDFLLDDDGIADVSDFVLTNLVKLAGAYNKAGDGMKRVQYYFDNAGSFLSLANYEDNYRSLRKSVQKATGNGLYDTNRAVKDIKVLINEGYMNRREDNGRLGGMVSLERDSFLLQDAMESAPDYATHLLTYAWHMMTLDNSSISGQAMLTEPEEDMPFWFEQVQELQELPEDVFREKMANDVLATVSRILEHKMAHPDATAREYMFDLPKVMALYILFIYDHSFEEKNEWLISPKLMRKYFPHTYSKVLGTINRALAERET